MYSLLRDLHEKDVFHSPWIVKIKSILNNAGMADMWERGDNIDHKWFPQTIKQRLTDIYNQNLQASVYENGNCKFYRIITENTKLEPYLIRPSNSD